MAYHAHDPTGSHPGYQSSDENQPFMEEDDNKYASGKYDSKDDPFGGGYKSRDEEERKEKEASDFEKQIETEQPKEKIEDESFFMKRVAEEVFHEPVKVDKGVQKKTVTSIEKAIENAVKEEKEVLNLD